MFIRKAHAGSAPGHTWTHDGQVIEVEDALAHQLLDIPHGGFSIADTPEPETEETEEPADLPEEEEATELLHVPEPEQKLLRPEPRTAGRPRLPRDGNGKIIRN